MRNNVDAPVLHEDRDGFRFRGGCLAIDLAATLQARLKPVPRELLAEPTDLDRWLISAGLVRSSPGATVADLSTARALREAIYTLASNVGREPFDESARNALNLIAAAPAAIPALSRQGQAHLGGAASELLSFLARDAVHLFGGPRAEQVRQCQAQACTIFFLDTSRSRDRRWCSMSACGNKAKVADFRRRKRETERKE